MAIGVPDLPTIEWLVIDAEAMAYIRHLVESLQNRTFDHACMVQITADVSPSLPDLFTQHRPVALNVGVPLDIASALNTLEDLLSIGSPTLAAYTRVLYRETRAFHEEKVRIAMAEFRSVDDLVVDGLDFLEGVRARLAVARAAKQQVIDRIDAAEAAMVVEEETWGALVLERAEADAKEAAVVAEFARLWPSYVAMRRHRGIAEARVRGEASALFAMPELPGHWEDEVVMTEAAERYIHSVLLLHGFLQ